MRFSRSSSSRSLRCFDSASRFSLRSRFSSSFFFLASSRAVSNALLFSYLALSCSSFSFFFCSRFISVSLFTPFFSGFFLGFLFTAVFFTYLRPSSAAPSSIIHSPLPPGVVCEERLVTSTAGTQAPVAAPTSFTSSSESDNSITIGDWSSAPFSAFCFDLADPTPGMAPSFAPVSTTEPFFPASFASPD